MTTLDALDVACPACQAKVGEPCTQSDLISRHPVKTFHESREARAEESNRVPPAGDPSALERSLEWRLNRLPHASKFLVQQLMASMTPPIYTALTQIIDDMIKSEAPPRRFYLDWEGAYHELKDAVVRPPEGWFTLGTHASTADLTAGEPDLALEFWGMEGGLPLWERPIQHMADCRPDPNHPGWWFIGQGCRMPHSEGPDTGLIAEVREYADGWDLDTLSTYKPFDQVERIRNWDLWVGPNSKGVWPSLAQSQFDNDRDEWELEHGHDVRMKCYPEFGCQVIESYGIRLLLKLLAAVTPTD